MPKSWKTFIVFSTSTVISPMKLFRRYFTEGWNKITPNIIANLQRNYFVGTLQWIIFFWRAFSIYKTFGFFFSNGNANKKEITNERFTDEGFLSMNQSVKYSSTEL